MFQAELDQARRVRAIQSAQREERANSRNWLRVPLPIIDHPDEILDQEPEDIVVVDEPEEEELEEIVQPEVVVRRPEEQGQAVQILVPDEELVENPIELDNQFVLHFDEDDEQPIIPPMDDNLANVLQGLRQEVANLRQEQDRMGQDTTVNTNNIQNQVRVIERERQNNLPGMLPTVAPNSLLKVFTGDDISETWQDWIDNFALAARSCGWDEQKKLHVLPTYLDGTAREVYGTL
ncbi:MAG: hypothetical protein GY861_23965, partial [bacterium]|nr:hypothetical protein [bacterium]